MNADKTDTRQWFLRITGKPLFGPVSTPGIVVWAEQGRILPGHEVSTDQITWVPADQVPELGIVWYIDDGAGNLRGPLNRAAAETILISGKAPPDARLVHTDKADLSRVIRPGAEPRANGAQAEKPSKDGEALRQRVTLLETDITRLKETLAAAKQAARQCTAIEHERDDLRLALAEAQSSNSAITHERDDLKLALAEAQSAHSAIAHERDDLKLALAEAQSAHSAIAHERDDLKLALAEAQSAYSELLTLSNTREAEFLARIEALEKPLSPVERAAEVCAADPGSALAHILEQEMESLDNDLAQEREAMAGLRDWSTRRQEAIQTRIHDLTRILNGETDVAASRRPVPDSGGRRHTGDAMRLQAEVATLRATQAQETRLFDEREAELTRKIHVLEAEDARLRARVIEADKLARHNQELAETIRRRDLELSQERKQREVEREHLATAQQALLRRIEQLEHTSDTRAEEASADTREEPVSPATREPNRTKLSAWIRLKR